MKSARPSDLTQSLTAYSLYGRYLVLISARTRTVLPGEGKFVTVLGLSRQMPVSTLNEANFPFFRISSNNTLINYAFKRARQWSPSWARITYSILCVFKFF
jgi:hypothetical protein